MFHPGSPFPVPFLPIQHLGALDLRFNTMCIYLLAYLTHAAPLSTQHRSLQLYNSKRVWPLRE